MRGLAWFARSWLDRLNLDATQCAVIRGRGESMEPTLPDGCSILFDRNRRTPRDGRIHVVRAGDGLIVKRVVMCGSGWELASENPAVEAEPWPPDAEVVGEVMWVAQTLI
ncbi:MAG: S24 family peptidase [Rhodospirillales bacterium]|nr:S24 family peptidase [Rhodospirillales bacterium]